MRTESGDLAITFTLTPEEYRAAFHRQLRRSPVGFVLPIAGVIGVAAGAAIGSGGTVLMGVSSLILFGLLIGIAPRSQMKGPQPNQHMVFNPQGVYLADGAAETRSAWSLFKAFDEAPDVFLLKLRASNRAIVVPKRAFDSPAEVDQFRELARWALPN